jgi:hypothetical protein
MAALNCIYTDYVMSYLEQFVDSMRFLEKFDNNQKKEGLNYEDVSRGIERNLLDEELQNFLDNNLGNAANGFIRNSPGNLANLCHSVSQQFYENSSCNNCREREIQRSRNLSGIKIFCEKDNGERVLSR